mgnify:CR=1 FL=1
MFLEKIIMSGYGMYVWPAFMFSFTVCYFLYVKTKKEFIKQETVFLKKFKQSESIKIIPIKEKKSLSVNLIS